MRFLADRNRIGDGSIIARIQQIFEGHNDLLIKFAQFLPPDTGMNLTSQQPIQSAVPPPVNPFITVAPLVSRRRVRRREIPNEQEVATRYVSLIKSRFASDKNYTYNQFMSILQDYQSGQKDMRSVIQQVRLFDCSNTQIVDLFRGNDDLIQQFVMFLPREFQYEATVMISQMNQPVVQAKPAESFPPTHPPYETGVQAEYVPASRRRPVRATRPRATAPAPSRRRHAYEEEEAEEETDTLPPSERRFFERCRREIPSDATYRQFLQLLDLFTKVGFSARSQSGRVFAVGAVHGADGPAPPASPRHQPAAQLPLAQGHQRGSRSAVSPLPRRCRAPPACRRGSKSTRIRVRRPPTTCCRRRCRVAWGRSAATRRVWC